MTRSKEGDKNVEEIIFKTKYGIQNRNRTRNRLATFMRSAGTCSVFPLNIFTIVSSHVLCVSFTLLSSVLCVSYSIYILSHQVLANNLN